VRLYVGQIYKIQHLEVSGAVRPIYASLGFKRLRQVVGTTAGSEP